MEAMAKRLLVYASIGHFTVALLHYVMPFLGSWAYAYFGAPELTKMAETGSNWPAISTFALAVIFTVFGAMGLSAAGIMRSWPYIRAVLWVVGIVYVLRGLLVTVQISYVLQGLLSARHAVYSMVALAIGLCQLWGLWRSRGSRTSTPSHAA